MKKYIIPLLYLLIVVAMAACKDKNDPINGGDTPVPVFKTDKDTYTIGDVVHLINETANQDDIVSYYWHFGFDGPDGRTTTRDASVLYARPGTYTVKLTVTNTSGNYATKEAHVVIHKVNEPPVVDFTAGAALVNTPVAFTDLSQDDGKIVAWQWSFGDGATSQEQHPQHTYAAVGFVTVQLKVTDDQGAVGEREKTIQVRSSLTPGVLSILWTQTFESASTLRSVSPAVGDNTDVYVTSNGLKLYAYTPNGVQKWAFDMTTGGATGNQESSPSVGADGTIYIGVGYGSSSTKSYLYAINPDGSQKWEFLIGSGARVAYTSPTQLADGTIAIGNRGSGGMLKVVDANGTLRWSVTPTGGVGGGMAADKAGNVYAGSTGNNGFSISSAVTERVSTTYLGAGAGANGTYPAIDAEGNVYVVVDNGTIGTLMAYSPDGVKKWEFAATGRIDQGGPVIGADGTIYIGSKDKNLYAITKGGSKRWAYTNANTIGSVPAIDSEGNIHFTDDAGYYTILGADGTQKEQQKLGDKIWSSPVISDYGVIYVTVEDGGACKLIAIDYGIQGPANSPWAQMGQNARRTFLQK